MSYTIMTTNVEMALDTAKAQAMAYVWGRQDAGEGTKDTGYSEDFAEAYRARKARYLSEQSHMMPNIESAFKQWRDTGEIA